MIISKTPFRISFFGGGTDFKDYYENHGGIVIGATINKYCYITLRKLPNFFENKYRFVWNRIELPNEINKIIHPSIKASIKFFKIKEGLEIIHASDLPSRSGIGSSSSFSVGLINCLGKLNRKNFSKKNLANYAINLEQNIMKESVGSQDQIWAANGGFNQINFSKNKYTLNKIKISKAKKDMLSNNLILFFTGKSRYSGIVEKDKIKNIRKKINYYHEIKEYTVKAKKVFESKNLNTDEIGLMLNEYWHMKKKLSNKVTDNNINSIYHEAISSGALGGKVLGAGGGGFLMFYANDSVQKKLKKKFNKLTAVKIKFFDKGSEVIFNNE
tara:strand:+ start:389 stop:1372 length:984 start_codon:yes stop_codon:yes gene_type:complete